MLTRSISILILCLQSSSESERALYGYKAQCELLAEHLEQLIAGCEARTQSLICEGARVLSKLLQWVPGAQHSSAPQSNACLHGHVEKCC